MAAANTDKFRKLARKFVTQVGSGGISDAVVTTGPMGTTTGLPTDTAIDITYGRVDQDGEATPTLEETITGVVSGSNIVSMVRGVEGTAQAHGAGIVAENLLNAATWNSMVDGILVEHNQDGTHKETALDSMIAGTEAQGNIIYHNGTIWTQLAAGTSGQYLKTQGAGANPTWADVNISTDGWTSDSNTWTYASASTFTISGDKTAIFTKGTRLKFTQTTTKYAVVVSSSYGAPNTTVTIAVNTDYTIANAAITSPNYSYQTNPQGYPGWFAYTPTYAGFSANPTFTARFRIDGNMCTFTHVVTGDGTSNATTKTITLPVAPLNSQEVGALTAVKDNGSYSTGAGHYKFTAGNATASVFKNLIEVAWTSSGACNWSTAATAYEF